jgi:hypothetical protein
VVFARNFLRSIGVGTSDERSKLKRTSKNPVDDLRVIDMYEEATRSAVERLDERAGNWVQKFRSDEDAMLFTQAQFHRYQEVESFVRNQFSDQQAILDEIKTRKGAGV